VILRFGLATEGAGNRLRCIRGDVAGVEKRSAGQPVTIDEEAEQVFALGLGAMDLQIRI